MHASGSYGPRVAAALVYLHQGQFLSKSPPRMRCRICWDAFGRDGHPSPVASLICFRIVSVTSWGEAAIRVGPLALVRRDGSGRLAGPGSPAALEVCVTAMRLPAGLGVGPAGRKDASC